MFGKTKKQIEDLSRMVRSLEKDNRTLFGHIHEHEWDISSLRKYREHDRRVLYCHDCQRYPATDELTTAFCKICEDSCFRLKLKDESDVPKKTCLDDMDLFKKD
jgi:hypothetical protein